MPVNDEHIDDLFARRLGDLQVPPPGDAWLRIEKSLNAHRRNSRKYWLAAASIALLLSVTASVIYWQTNQNFPLDQETSPLAVQPEEREEPSYASVPEIAAPEPERNTVSPDEKITATPSLSEKTPEIPASEPEILAQLSENTREIKVPEQETETLSDDSRTETKDVSTARHTAEKQPKIPVYIDSGEELIRKNPSSIHKAEILARLLNPEKMEDEKIAAIIATPVYDDIPGYAPYRDIPVSSRPNKRWEIAGRVAPVYSYRAITNVPDNLSRSDFNNAESPLLAYSGGVSVAYKVVRRLSIQTGVYYSQMGQTINNVVPVSNMYASVSSNNPYAKNFVRTSSGDVTVVSNLKSHSENDYATYFNHETQEASAVSTNTVATANASSPNQYKLIERIDYLEIPVILRYKLIDRKLNLSLLGGMSTNILIDNNVFIDNGSDMVKDGTILMARPVNYSSTVGLGFSYQLTHRLLIDIEPSFKYYLKSYTTNSSISSNPYSFGVYTGIMYRF